MLKFGRLGNYSKLARGSQRFQLPTRIIVRRMSEEKWWKRTTIYTIPNVITTARILSSPFLTYAVMNDMKIAALGGCVVFAFTDWLDGYLAKTLDQRSLLGAYLDPAADKIMIGALTAGLVYKDMIPIPLAGLMLARDVALMSCAAYLRHRDKPADKAFFDVEDTTFVIVPSMMSKVNTGMQFLLISATLSHFALDFPTLVDIEPLWWITGTTTLISGLGYLDGSGLHFFKSRKQDGNLVDITANDTPPASTLENGTESKVKDSAAAVTEESIIDKAVDEQSREVSRDGEEKMRTRSR